MKKIFIVIFIFGMLCFNMSFAQTSSEIGIKLLKDPYNKKVFILKILQNSITDKYNIKEGMEIISIDGKKLKDLDIKQIANLLKGKECTEIKFILKINKEQKTVTIPRTQLQIPQSSISDFDIYWRKVAPENIIIEPIAKNILENISKKFYVEIVPAMNYWVARKAHFEDGYNVCMTYPENIKKQCLVKLTHTEINKTKKDNEEDYNNSIMENAYKNSISANIFQIKNY